MSALRAGLSAVGRRTNALGGEDAAGQNGGDRMIVRGDRHEITRRIISGFVPIDDTDAAIGLVEEVGTQIVEMLGSLLPDAELTEHQMLVLLSTAQSACAQMLAVGGATQMAVDGRLA